MPVISFTSKDGDLVIIDGEHFTPDQEAKILAAAPSLVARDLSKTFLELKAREARWLAQASEEQQQIGWGDYAWLRVTGDGSPLGPPSATIYGHIATRDQFITRERQAIRSLQSRGLEAVAEAEETLALLDAAYPRGWRYGNWFSKIEPDGELGEHHVVNLHPISTRAYRLARIRDWPDTPPTEEEVAALAAVSPTRQQPKRWGGRDR
jgi:hypothetical protein